MTRNTPLLIISFLLISQSMLISQNLDKFYSRRVQEGGDIFFVFPNEDFKNTTNHSPFFFDITLREGNDTAHINFTYYTNDPSPANGLTIKSGANVIAGQAEKLYVDFVKHQWEHRYSANFNVDDLQKMMVSATPPKFELETKNGDLAYDTRNKKWQKYSDAIDKVFYIIFPEKFE
jgi:hypothetical protein